MPSLKRTPDRPRMIKPFLNSDAPLKPRIIILFSGLLIANLLVWLWALLTFGDKPVLLGTCALAYVLGLRHAVDPDHIAAIDNVTRKLMQEGKKPLTVGLFFALGHSTLICVAVWLIAITARSFDDATFADWRDYGGLFSTLFSASFLFIIALFNFGVFINVVKTARLIRMGKEWSEEELNRALNGRGLIARLMRPLFQLISRGWHMFPLGFLFGLGFDTATEISLFGIAAAEAAGGCCTLISVMIFPALFTVGMALVDTLDGVLMVGAYQWAYLNPRRKIVYNLIITGLSVIVALGIGLIEVLGLVHEKLDLTGAFWDHVGMIWEHFGDLGFGIIGIFALAWGVSWFLSRPNRALRIRAE